MGIPILVVDDDRFILAYLENGLGQAGFEVSPCPDAATALHLLREQDFEAVLVDFVMPGTTGVELCREIRALRPDLPVLILTGQASVEAAVDALRAGACDFIQKPVQMEQLISRMRQAVEKKVLGAEVRRLQDLAGSTEQFAGLLGECPDMRRVRQMLARLVDSEATVLITGESGTGKEVVARALHEHSRRRHMPFVDVNCAALPATLLESELFGHARGSFTDARQEHAGLFVQASGGTLFLDEVGELPVLLQAKLLRALEERSVRPVGSHRRIAFDARLVTATNRDIEAALVRGELREDLYYRLNVVRIDLPPLSARGSDILLLAQHFLTRFADRSDRPVRALSPDAAELLLGYRWPGNVRELRNCMERAVALARYEALLVEDLPEHIREYRRIAEASSPLDSDTDRLPLEEIERRHILRVLESVSGNKKVAAGILGLDRRTLYRKLERYSIDAPPKSLARR